MDRMHTVAKSNIVSPPVQVGLMAGYPMFAVDHTSNLKLDEEQCLHLELTLDEYLAMVKITCAS